MDLNKKVKADHDALRRVMEKIDKTRGKETKKRTELLAEMKSLLLLHSRAEEEVVYKRAVKNASLREHILEAREEHEQAERILGELEALDPDAERWEAKFSVLREMIEHHMEEEEDELLPQAAQDFSEEEIDSLGDELDEKENELRAKL